MKEFSQPNTRIGHVWTPRTLSRMVTIPYQIPSALHSYLVATIDIATRNNFNLRFAEAFGILLYLEETVEIFRAKPLLDWLLLSFTLPDHSIVYLVIVPIFSCHLSLIFPASKRTDL
jgi:hypothetical protein